MDTLPPLSPVTPSMLVFWNALMDARKLAKEHNGPGTKLRENLVAKYGEPRPGINAHVIWGHDPDCARLSAMNTIADKFAEFEGDREDDVLSVPAVSVADLAYKLAVVGKTWREQYSLESPGEHYEKIALDFFEDAWRLLLPLMPAGC